MARKLAKSTVARLAAKLEAERERLLHVIAEREEEFESLRLSVTPSEHNVDPENSDGGSLAFEMQKEMSIERNAEGILEKVDHALARVGDGTYGDCETCGKRIPMSRLDALPYATHCVDCASRQ
ncbi:MAG: TraR/DksA C4-type zinc finger protein [Acidimicrobiia bacterium]|nr:TraR/DksA C4-type zinc finger protein [Acidimicrobiia bacterium]